jgi:hypothetical protein
MANAEGCEWESGVYPQPSPDTGCGVRSESSTRAAADVVAPAFAVPDAASAAPSTSAGDNVLVVHVDMEGASGDRVSSPVWREASGAGTGPTPSSAASSMLPCAASPGSEVKGGGGGDDGVESCTTDVDGGGRGSTGPCSVGGHCSWSSGGRFAVGAMSGFHAGGGPAQVSAAPTLTPSSSTTPALPSAAPAAVGRSTGTLPLDVVKPSR